MESQNLPPSVSISDTQPRLPAIGNFNVQANVPTPKHPDGFERVKGPGDKFYLVPASNAYQVIFQAVNTAFALLWTIEAKRALVHVGNSLVDGWEAQKGDKKVIPTRLHVDHTTKGNMGHLVDIFLRKLHANFAPVKLDFLDDGDLVYTQRSDWSGIRELASGASLGVISLNRLFIEYASKSMEVNAPGGVKNRAGFHFHLTLTLVHEITHLFTGFLSGNRRPNTPPKARTKIYGDRLNGEAGRVFEIQFFNGYPEMRYIEGHSLGYNQAGSPVISDDEGNLYTIPEDEMNKLLKNPPEFENVRSYRTETPTFTEKDVEYMWFMEDLYKVEQQRLHQPSSSDSSDSDNRARRSQYRYLPLPPQALKGCKGLFTDKQGRTIIENQNTSVDKTKKLSETKQNISKSLPDSTSQKPLQKTAISLQNQFQKGDQSLQKNSGQNNDSKATSKMKQNGGETLTRRPLQRSAPLSDFQTKTGDKSAKENTKKVNNLKQDSKAKMDGYEGSRGQPLNEKLLHPPGPLAGSQTNKGHQSAQKKNARVNNGSKEGSKMNQGENKELRQLQMNDKLQQKPELKAETQTNNHGNQSAQKKNLQMNSSNETSKMKTDENKGLPIIQITQPQVTGSNEAFKMKEDEKKESQLRQLQIKKKLQQKSELKAEPSQNGNKGNQSVSQSQNSVTQKKIK